MDFDGDGRIDLGTSAVDAIGLVASYQPHLQLIPGMPTCITRGALAPDILPTFNVLAGRGAGRPAAPWPAGDGGAPRRASPVLTRTPYNWSSYYALAVIELGCGSQGRTAAVAVQAAGAGTASHWPAA